MAVVSMMGVVSVDRGIAAHAATRMAADTCAAPLPANRVLPTTGGIQTYTTLRGGGYTFNLNQFGAHGLDATVQRFFGVTPPPGDAVATWSFTLPGGAHGYYGVAHVFQQGVSQRVCLQGTAYLNLGNGSAATQAPAIKVYLTGTIGATSARVDLRVDGVPYDVYGHPFVRQGCRVSASGMLVC